MRSVRTTPRSPARVSLYLRPVEFEIQQQQMDVLAARRAAEQVAGPRWDQPSPVPTLDLPDNRPVPALA